MPKIITGYTGEPHVSSDDMASLQQSMIGNGDYLLCDDPNNFVAKQINMSTIQLSKAEFVLQGTHIRILETDQVTIDDGQSGVNRTDLIVVAYKKDESGVESAEIKVIKGQPGVSPLVPELEQEDIRNGGRYREAALFEVSLNGMSISSIRRVCYSVKSQKAIEDLSSKNADDIAKITKTIGDIQNYTVLWSGALYMNENQTIKFSKKISEFTNGIVLVFSAYVDGQASNWDFHSFFVPKHFVKVNNGCGCDFNMVYGLFTYLCRKYIYISDDHITGHANNQKSGTRNNIVYNNKMFVLRYVIGF